MIGARTRAAALAAVCLAGGSAPAAEPQVTIEAKWVTVPAGFADRNLPADRLKTLTAEDVRAFLAAAQGEAGANVLAAPVLTAVSGREATAHVGGTRQFVTGLTVSTKDGNPVFVPHTTSVDTGLTLAVRPTAAADRRSVHLDLRASRAASGPGKLLPVTSMITPVVEGGSHGPSVPFTQYIEVPETRAREVARKVTLPVGGTAVVGGWREPAADRDPPQPVLGKVPYLNRLFRNVSAPPAENEVLLLVTAREVRAEPEAAADAPAGVVTAAFIAAEAGGQGRAAELVAAYRRACAAGDREAARRLAAEALALDPACFADGK